MRLRGYSIVIVPLMIFLLLVSIIPSVALTEETATYLLKLYEEAKQELTLTLNTYFSPTSSEENISTTTLETMNETTTESESESAGPYIKACSDIYEEVKNSISLADQYAYAAKKSLDSGNYKLASQLALKALNTLGEAYVHLAKCVSILSVPRAMGNETSNATGNLSMSHEMEMHIAPGLLSAILRHEIRLSRLEAAISASEALGINVSYAWELINEVKDLLSQARELALEGDTQGSTSAIVQANKIMSLIVKVLKTSSSDAVKHRKIHNETHGIIDMAGANNHTKEKIKEKLGHGKGHEGSNDNKSASGHAPGKENITETARSKEKGKEKEDHGYGHSGKGSENKEQPPGLEKRGKEG